MEDTNITATREVRAKIVEYVRLHPELTYTAIAAELNCGYSTLAKLLREAGYRRRSYVKLASLDLRKLEG